MILYMDAIDQGRQDDVLSTGNDRTRSHDTSPVGMRKVLVLSKFSLHEFTLATNTYRHRCLYPEDSAWHGPIPFRNLRIVMGSTVTKVHYERSIATHYGTEWEDLSVEVVDYWSDIQ